MCWPVMHNYEKLWPCFESIDCWIYRESSWVDKYGSWRASHCCEMTVPLSQRVGLLLGYV